MEKIERSIPSRVRYMLGCISRINSELLLYLYMFACFEYAIHVHACTSLVSPAELNIIIYYGLLHGITACIVY